MEQRSACVECVESRSACGSVRERWAQCVWECAGERWAQCVWECAGERWAQCVWECAGERWRVGVAVRWECVGAMR